jgi:two-component system, LuxR family, sensor kinase FixL
MIATRKNGETFPALISFSVTQLEDRMFFTGIVRDLTETKKLQEKLIKSDRLAALGQSVAEITHEIKNPLMLIGGFTRQLENTITDEKGLQKIGIITNEIDRLERLLAELRDFYLPSPIASEKVDIKEIQDETFSLIKKECTEKSVKVRFDIQEGARFVLGDANKLKQVFLNLYKNAVEAMEHGGTLTISAEPEADGNARITVSDDGCGIPQAEMDSIFSPFYTTKKGGTGLGLAVSRRIIDQHEGGSMQVKSEEGKGTTFTIILPLYREN